MPTPQVFPTVPLPYRIAVLVVALSFAAFAVFTAQPLLGFLAIAGIVLLAAGIYFVYLFFHLFYRLVIAVERIADER